MSRNRLATVFFVLFSAYICFEAWHLGVGTWRKPGSGFLSFYVGMVLGILALVVLFEAGEAKPRPGKGHGSWRGSSFSFLSLLGYVVLLKPLGFIPTTFLFMLFLIKGVEGKTWRAAVLTALLVTAAAYGLFDIGLKSSLPKGVMNALGL
jgi:putative tricarboxylic transport membrane protein